MLALIILSSLLSLFTPDDNPGKERTTVVEVHYRQDKSNYDPSLLGNEEAIAHIAELAESLGPDKLHSIDVVSWASPEGVSEHNANLCKSRSRATRNVLAGALPSWAVRRIKTREGGESWGPLRERILQDTLITEKTRKKVLTILDADIYNGTRKWRLEHTLGKDPNVGDVYRYLLRHHYRYIRGSFIVIKFEEPDDGPVSLPDDGSMLLVDDGAAILLGEDTGRPEADDVVAPEADDVVAPETDDVVAPEADDVVAPETDDVVELHPDEPEQQVDEVEPPSVISSEVERSPDDDTPAPEEDTVVPPADTTATVVPVDTTATVAPVDTTATVAPVDTTAVATPKDKRPILGIGTNLIYDATYIPHYGFTSIPSFSVEYYPAGPTHYSFGANVEWPMWRHPDTHKYMQIQNIDLWARRYFKPQEGHFQGIYLSAGANVFRYGIGWDAKGWEGEGIGADLGFGYKHMIGRSRWWFDTGIDIGGFVSRYDPYVYGNDATGWYYYDYGGKPEDFKERQHLRLWFGPTRVYFSIGLDIFARKRK